MKIVNSSRGDVLEMRGGGGVLMLFGLPFLATGLFVLGMGLGLIPVKNGPPVFIAVPFGALFALGGGLLMFGRRGCVMDRAKGTIEYWSGILVPMFRKTHRIADLARVTLSKEIRRSDKSSYTVYPVRLVGADLKLNIGEAQRYEKSRQLAEQLAEFLQLPLADSSLGEEIVRAPEELNVPLKERLVREGEAPLPEPPPGMQSRILRRGSAVRIEIPPMQGGIAAMIKKIISIFFGFFMLVIFGIIAATLYQAKKPDPMTFILPGAFLVFMIVAFAVFFRKVLPRLGSAPTRVTVTPDELRVEYKAGFTGIRTDVIPAGELEELLLMQQPGGELEKLPPMLSGLVSAPIIARSDRTTIQFAGHLPRAEKEFLVAVIKHALKSG